MKEDVMQIHSGMICLQELYKHTLTDLGGGSIKGNSALGRKYGKTVKEIATQIPTTGGFYIWGKYEKNKLWRTIYLGKAGFGKTTSLKARITEELKDERIFLWHGEHTGLREESLMKIAQVHYPNLWHKGKKHFSRAILKSGSTHIIWAETPNEINGDVRKIEADLIETMNPIANLQRPGPISGLELETIEIVRAFKKQIHDGRKRVYILKGVNK